MIVCGGWAVLESLMRAYHQKRGVPLMQLWGVDEHGYVTLTDPAKDVISGLVSGYRW